MSSVDTAAEPGPYPRSTSARGETAGRALDEAARRAATEAGRAATEAEKARAEDIVAVGAADDGCVRSRVRAKVRPRRRREGTRVDFRCAVFPNRRIAATRGSWLEHARLATWEVQLEVANHGRAWRV